MKYLKSFEWNDDKQISVLGISKNYYVKINRSAEFAESYNEFLDLHIGKITEISINNFNVNDSYIYVNFEIEKGSKYEYNNFTHSFKIIQVEFSAKTKDELLQKISANKYNL